MRLSRIFTESDLKEHVVHMLDERAANYVARVLRMRAGDALLLFNGDHYDYKATILRITRKEVAVCLDEKYPAAARPELQIHLGQVMSRGERMDYAVQKSVELGLTHLTPLSSEYCEVRLPKERQEKRVNHWRQVAVSACEQCGRADLPVVAPICPVGEWVNAVGASLKLILDPRSENTWADEAKPDSVALLIGPEGGLTENEVAQAARQGFQTVRLGPRILRTETAPVAVLSLIQWLWGDFRNAR